MRRSAATTNAIPCFIRRRYAAKVERGIRICMPKKTQLPPKPPAAFKRIVVDVMVSVMIEGGVPMLYIGEDIAMPISRMRAWSLIFGPDETMEEFLGFEEKPTKKKLPKSASDTRRKNDAARHRKGLCLTRTCENKFVNGKMFCKSCLVGMKANIAKARASKKGAVK